MSRPAIMIDYDDGDGDSLSALSKKMRDYVDEQKAIIKDYPSCFNSVDDYLVWKYLALKTVKKKLADNICMDCSPEYKREMVKQGRCQHPETKFFVINRYKDKKYYMSEMVGVSNLNSKDEGKFNDKIEKLTFKSRQHFAVDTSRDADLIIYIQECLHSKLKEMSYDYKGGPK